MIYNTDGSPFYGTLAPGQTWTKGNREKTIVYFDNHIMQYQTKKNIENETVTEVYRSTFRNWIDGAKLKEEEV